jgi:trk system potassium uptake protein TrkH
MLVIQRLTGLLLMLYSLTMLPALVFSLIIDDGATDAFERSAALCMACGVLIWLPVRGKRRELKVSDGFLLTTLFWVVLGLFGGLPLHLSDRPGLDMTDAIFESVSGLTTTGATAMTGLDTLPQSILLWRSQLQWMGGMGVIVLAVAILPLLGVGGMQLVRAETPGPMKNTKITARVQDTARALWMIYLMLTLACGLAYWLAGMSVFDAICHAFTTLSTGGYSTHDASMGYFDSKTIHLIAALFMALGGLSFAMHFVAWQRADLMTYWRDRESQVFLGLVAAVTLLVTTALLLGGTYVEIGDSFVNALFQVISIGTSTGYATADFTTWPSFIPMALLLGSFAGGCAGSTAGGIKIIRVILLAKQGLREIQRIIHPHAVVSIKFGGRRLDARVVNSVWSFITVYVALFAIMFLGLLACGLDEVTAVSAVATSMNNLGPGLGEIASNVTTLNDPAKWIMVVAMLLGRLELFTVLVIFTPAFWRR